MDVLLFHIDPAKLKILSFCLESQLDIQVKQAATLEQAMTFLLDEKGLDLIVVSESDQLSVFMKYLMAIGAKIPLILIGRQSSELSTQNLPGLSFLARINESVVATELPEIIRANYKMLTPNPTTEDAYCRINVELLCDITPLTGDVYVRLSNVKYVKIFNSGIVFTEKDLNRLLGIKRIDYLYILRSAAPEFVSRLKDRLVSIASTAEDGDDRMLSTIAHVQETIYDLTAKFGFTEPVMELTKTHVDLTIKVIGKFPRLNRIFEGSLFRNTNYISSHSIMVAHVACAIAARLNWQSDSTFQKLIVTSFLHDITLGNPEHAKIHSRKDLADAKARLPPEEYARIENHPFVVSQLVNKLHEIPGDVYVIALQHHERPDGTGFPRGLSAATIAPLAAVFIAAHEFVEAHQELGDKFDLDVFWKSRLAAYSAGTFKKIAKAFLEPVKAA